MTTTEKKPRKPRVTKKEKEEAEKKLALETQTPVPVPTQPQQVNIRVQLQPTEASAENFVEQFLPKNNQQPYMLQTSTGEFIDIQKFKDELRAELNQKEVQDKIREIQRRDEERRRQEEARQLEEERKEKEKLTPSKVTESRIGEKDTEEEIRMKIVKKIGYLIIQEFPTNNISYVVGYRPYGKVWFDYLEVLQQYTTLMEEWQAEFDNNEIKSSKRPRIVKIFIMDDENVAGSDCITNYMYESDEFGTGENQNLGSDGEDK